MQGTLTTTCLPDLLRSIYTHRRTGELILNQGNIRKQIYFELGQIVFAASNRKEDRLGEALVRHGKLTRAQLEQFLGTLGRGKRLGRSLVERGIMTDRELVTYVTFQVIDIIYSLFTWTLGDFEFAEGEHNRAPEELKLRFSTATIILEGVRRVEDFDIIRRGLGDLNRLIAPTASPLLRLQSITLKPLERQVLDLVSQPLDILRVLIATQEQPQKVLQALYGLLSVGLLQQVAGPELSTTTGKFVIPEGVRQQAEAAPPPEYAARGTAPLRAEDTNLLGEIEAMKERLTTRNAYQILGLSAQTTASEIRDAYYRLASRFHPDKFIQHPRQVREDIDVIFNAISESYNALRASQITGPQPALAAQGQSGARLAPPPPGYQASAPTEPAASAAAEGRLKAGTEDVDYPGYKMHKLPQRSPVGRRGSVDVETALNDLLEYLDDRKAPLFVADSLSTLLRTQPPIYVERLRLIEAVVTWARQKATVTGRPMHEMLVGVLSSIKHAEQARVLQDFEPQLFYATFIRELVGYCPPGEAQDFLAKASAI